MIIRYLLCSFFMLGLTLGAQAQLQKGSWMVNGILQQRNFSLNTDLESFSSFDLELAPELSYMVTKHLMLGGQLGIGLRGNVDRRFAPVSQHLLVRHFFKRLDNFYLFYGGELMFSKFTITEVGGGSRNIKIKSAFLQSGVMIFLQEAIGLEFLFNYEMISFQADSRLDRTFTGGGLLQLEGRLQFFIHPENKSNPRQTDYRFYPGDWLIGGNFQIGGNDFVRPEIQRFWGSGWTTGLRLETEINVSFDSSVLGVTPVVRKYFRPEKKGKLWLQAGAGIQGNYAKVRDRETMEEWWTTIDRTLSAEGTIGWSNLISDNFALDFFITRRYAKSFSGIGGSTLERSIFSTGLTVSGLLR